MDIVYLLLTTAFFWATGWLVAGCDALGGAS